MINIEANAATKRCFFLGGRRVDYYYGRIRLFLGSSGCIVDSVSAIDPNVNVETD